MAEPASRRDAASADSGYGDHEKAGVIGEVDAIVQTENTQYQGAGPPRSSPALLTAEGEGELIASETQFEEARPGTAGSIHSGQLDPNDQAVLERTARTQNSLVNRAGADQMTPHISRFLDRPDIPTEPSVSSSFSFFKPDRQKMDFSGVRKGPAGKEHDEVRQEFESASKEFSLPKDNVTVDEQTGHVIEQPAAAGYQANLQNDAPSEQKKRKRKKKKHPVEGVSLEPIDTIGLRTDAHDLHDDYSQAELINQAAPAVAVEYVQHGPGQAPPNTPDKRLPTIYEEDQQDSPHAQLRNDIEAASQLSCELIEVHQPSPQHHSGYQAVSIVEHGSPARAPRRHPQDTQETASWKDGGPNHISHQQLAPSISGKAPKKKRKASHATTNGVRLGCKPTEQYIKQSGPSYEDYFQVMINKIREQEAATASKFFAERDSLELGLRDVSVEKQLLQDQFDAALQENNRLSATVEKQKARITTFESKVRTFKTFVDGLGNDIDALKKDANSLRRKGEVLVEEKGSQEAERKSLFDQLNECTEKSAQLKHEALSAYNQANLELQSAVLKCNHLEIQLSESGTRLADERDRRSQLERQLESAETLDRKIERLLTAQHNEMLDKLYQLHAALEQERESEDTNDILKKTFALVQALDSQSSATIDDIGTVKDLVETLNESVENRLSSQTVPPDVQEVVSSCRTHLDEYLTKLREEFDRGQALKEKEQAHDEDIKALEDRLAGQKFQLDEAHTQLSAVQARERELQKQSDTPQAKVTALQSDFPPEDLQISLNKARAELRSQSDALESVKTDLTQKEEELRKVKSSNADFQDQIQNLKHRLSEMESTPSGVTFEQQKAQQDADQIRAEMAAHAEQFKTDLVTKTYNDMKRLSSERNRAEKQLKTVSEELAAIKTQSENQNSEKAAQRDARDEELERLKKLAQSQKHDIDTLHASVDQLQTSTKGDADLKEKYATLSTQFSSETTKLKEVTQEKSTLLKRITDLQQTADGVKSAGDQARAELETYRTEQDSAIKKLERELGEAKEEAARVSAGFEHLKQSCEKAVEDANEKRQHQVQALQESLSEAQGELQLKKNEAEKFTAEVEQTWQQELKNFEEQTAQLRRQAAEAESEMEKARNDYHALSKGDSVSSKTRREAPEWRNPPTNAGVASKDDFIIHQSSASASHGLGSTTEQLRHTSRSIIEATQYSDPVLDDPLGASKATRGFSTKVSDIDNALDLQNTQQSTQVVPETQFEEDIPSFAATSARLAAAKTNHHSQSSPLSFVDENLLQEHAEASGLRLERKHVTDGFTIRPDSNITSGSRDQGDNGQLKQAGGTLFRNQEEEERYTYRKSFPIPNSASKRVPSDGASARADDSRDSYHRPDENASKYSFDQGTVRGEGHNTSMIHSQYGKPSSVGSAHSSSPGFMTQDWNGGRKMNTYHSATHSSGKRRASNLVPNQAVDPRLAGRSHPEAPKRKVNDYIVEGYEHERNKRLNTGAKQLSRGLSSSGHIQRHSSFNDLPAMPGSSAGSRYGSQPVSQLRLACAFPVAPVPE